MSAKHDIEVQLTGNDSNIFNLVGIACRALREAGYKEDADILMDQVMGSGSFDEALKHVTDMVEVS